jgi:hypothetical protein
MILQQDASVEHVDVKKISFELNARIVFLGTTFRRFANLESIDESRLSLLILDKRRFSAARPGLNGGTYIYIYI